MQTLWGAGLYLASSVGAALGLLVWVRRCWSPERMKDNNVAATFFGTVLGTFYAVMVAFMLTKVWNDFQDAQANAEQEADALVGIFRLASAFPAPVREPIQSRVREYTQMVVRFEWAAMAREQPSPECKAANDRLWRSVQRIVPRNASEQIVQTEVLNQLTRMAEHRRLRELQTHSRLPAILWAVLLIGQTLTVGVSYLFGVDSFLLHALKTAALTLLTSLVLIAIALVDNPFQGAVHVAPDGFQLALTTFDRLDASSHPCP